jgi:antitoxin component YwqK of YwqJK toxin-antitoxin module
MNKLFPFFFILFLNAAIGQSIDTMEYYLIENIGKGSEGYWVNGKNVTEEEYLRCEALEAHNMAFFQSDTKLHYMIYKTIDGAVTSTQYQVDVENGPYGEYTCYYANGRVKVHGFYEMPNDSMSNPCKIDSTWTYYDETGVVIATKRYKNGLAHGKWNLYDPSTKKRVEKEFLHGFSNGTWTAGYYLDYYYEGQTCQFRNGFKHISYPFEYSFEMELDKKKYLHSCDNPVIIKPITYANDKTQTYIAEGKFYIIRDGIIIELVEYQKGELVKRIQYDH